jgi:DMSO/TMAO reductase YedYZ heme-binding membrane subunit
MDCRRETVEKGVPPDNRKGLVPRCTRKVHREVQHPRTAGRTLLLFTLAALRSVPQAGSQFLGRSSRFVKHLGYQCSIFFALHLFLFPSLTCRF